MHNFTHSFDSVVLSEEKMRVGEEVILAVYASNVDTLPVMFEIDEYQDRKNLKDYGRCILIKLKITLEEV